GVPASLQANIIAAGREWGFPYADKGTHVLGTIGANRNGTGMHGVAFGADLTTARVFGDTYYEWRRQASGGYLPEAVERTDPDGAARLDMYAQLQAQGVRAINHSWGISTRNMTVAALDAQHGRAFDQTSERLTASLTVLAREQGLQQVDHVLVSNATAQHPAGHNVFVVQGDPAN
uniref:XVIPCD domain-containing protein n=1 Tax=Acinetobacter indicus TaxID=756892 RepID=UPI001C08409B